MEIWIDPQQSNGTAKFFLQANKQRRLQTDFINNPVLQIMKVN